MSVLSARHDAPIVAASPVAPRLRRPSWRDRRLVVGVLLVLGSTVVGAHVLASQPHGTSVWVVRRDLAAGSTLRASDLESREVGLAGTGPRYVSATRALPAGAVLVRAVGRGELLPAAAVEVGARPDTQSVAVPVGRFHVPSDLARGDLVDVYVTPHDGAAPTSVRDAALLVRAVPVVDVDDGGARFGGSDSEGVVVAPTRDEVARLVGGISDGTIDVVRSGGSGT